MRRNAPNIAAPTRPTHASIRRSNGPFGGMLECTTRSAFSKPENPQARWSHATHEIFVSRFPRYLHYCEVNFDWTDFKYTLKSRQQKQNALAKFMSSNEWKNTRVTDMTRWLASQISFKEFFSRQIQ
jgi:hypothetical protein